ncbi:MAG TPA: hypothetical protein VF062_27020 [Candidatus Limnocylindrales bacterium]
MFRRSMIMTVLSPLAMTVATIGLAPMAMAAPAPAPFFTPAQSTGSLEVQLNPTSVVTPGVSVLVTFGVPLPRGSLTAAQLNSVRVLRNGTEIPAHVDQMTPWRHATNPSLDGTSVRVARIQIRHTFSAGRPEPVTVQWGGPSRTLDVPALADARTAWHRVTDGTTATGGPTFGATHNVFEPDVYAVLPKAWLTTAGLKSPMARLDDSVGPNRVNPSSVPASFPGYLEGDQAQVNFLYTIINEDDPLTGGVTDSNTNSFLTSDEPWLYDRGSVMHLGYLRSGYLRFLREAVRNTEFYRTKLWTPADCNGGRCVGSFKLKNPDAAASWHDQKYSYNESLALSHWLTGDTMVLPHIEHVVRVYDDVNNRVNASFYTERHVGLKLMAYTVAYEVTGKPEYRDGMLAVLNALRADQTAPSDGGPVDGGIWHTILSHEGDTEVLSITSPWMSALVADAAARLYLVTESPTAAQLLIGLAGHECGVGSYMTTIRDGVNPLADQSGGVHQRLPHYLATRNGLGYDGEFDPWSNMEHAPEVAATVAWGVYFAALTGDTAKEASLRTCADQLYTAFSHVITYWTRPAAPTGSNQDAYRNTPHRKYTWWYKNSSGFGWAMNSPATPAPTCGVSTTTAIYNRTFTAQSGTFTVVADATPEAVADTGVGVSADPPINEANSFSTAATVRFNTVNSRIEARSAATYPATTIPWSAGSRYRLRFVVNVPAHTYSAFVTAPGGTEQTIGTGLAFRFNYATAVSLNNLRGSVDGGSIQVCPVTLP